MGLPTEETENRTVLQNTEILLSTLQHTPWEELFPIIMDLFFVVNSFIMWLNHWNQDLGISPRQPLIGTSRSHSQVVGNIDSHGAKLAPPVIPMTAASPTVKEAGLSDMYECSLRYRTVPGTEQWLIRFIIKVQVCNAHTTEEDKTRGKLDLTPPYKLQRKRHPGCAMVQILSFVARTGLQKHTK